MNECVCACTVSEADVHVLTMFLLTLVESQRTGRHQELASGRKQEEGCTHLKRKGQ